MGLFVIYLYYSFNDVNCYNRHALNALGLDQIPLEEPIEQN